MHHLPKIGRNYILELYLHLHRFSRNLVNIILGLIQYAAPNRKIYRDFGALFTLNRTKIYMGAISKSEPNFPNFNRVRPWAKQMSCPKFHPIWIINATCQFNMDGRTDMHKSTQNVTLCIFSKGTMGLSRLFLPVTNIFTKT